MNFHTPALIPISQTQIKSQQVQTVNARELHKFLGVGKDFSSWIKNQIDRARLLENRDFVLFTQKGEQLPSGAKHLVEYHLTLDAGKHISMMSNTEKGFQVRDYFLACEKKATTMRPMFEQPPQKVIPQDRYCELLESENYMLRNKYENTRNPAYGKRAIADNILYDRFMKLYGNRMNLSAWMKLKEITLCEETVTKAIYRNGKISPQNFAILAHHLEFTRAEIINILEDRPDAKSFLSCYAVGGAE